MSQGMTNWRKRPLSAAGRLIDVINLAPINLNPVSLAQISGTLISVALIALTLLSWPSRAGEPATSFDTQLLTAEKIKRTDPRQFDRLIAALASNRANLSRQQQQHLDYLSAYQMSYQNKPQQALAMVNNILSADASDLTKFKTHILSIDIHLESKSWHQALKSLANLLTKLPQITNEGLYQSGLASAATLYTRLGQYQIGYNYASKLKARAVAGPNHCLAEQLIIKNKYKLGRLDALSDDTNLAISGCEKIEQNLKAIAIRSYVARQLIGDDNLTNARGYLLQHLPAAEQLGYPPMLASYYALLAKVAYVENDMVQANKFALQSLNQSAKRLPSESSLIAYKVLYQIAQQRHDYQPALEYLEQYSKANIAYLDEVKAKSQAFQLAQHNMLIQKNEVEFLKQQNTLLKSEKLLAISNSENDRLFIILLAMMVILLIFWVFKSRGVSTRLTVMAQYDDLTGAFSRSHFTEVASSAIRYCENTEQPLSCIVFDLDWFKSINDNHGHGCGDWALKQVVEQCRPVVRKNDIFARIGGEEFCIVLPGCSLTLAMTLAERCRQAVSAIDTSKSGADFELTASFGVTDVRLSGLALEKLMSDADKAMYQSKKSGRNRVSQFHATLFRGIKSS